MLVIDPTERISVDQALAHNYIRVFREESELNVVSLKFRTQNCKLFTQFNIVNGI